jgi:hypothetical protein
MPPCSRPVGQEIRTSPWGEPTSWVIASFAAWGLACFRERKTSRRAVDQAHAEFVLQRSNAAAKLRRLRLRSGGTPLLLVRLLVSRGAGRSRRGDCRFETKLN